MEQVRATRGIILKDELFIEAKLENLDAVQEFVGARLEECSTKIQNQIAPSHGDRYMFYLW